MREKIKLPPQVLRILEKLSSCGYEAFAVGGCVRDSLLGAEPSDWDICTNALPHETKSCFHEIPVIETGIQHGTVTLLIDHLPFEVTTYRIDGNYSDGRRPDHVCFTAQLQDDLSRRDFTINAMAYHPRLGIIDPFHGKKDLKRGILRCVGTPDNRFHEDGLRIMRGIRFVSQLGFSLEKETQTALYSCCTLLQKVSAERLRTELDKLLCGAAVEKTLRDHGEILACFIPELRPMFHLDQQNRHHIYTVWEHTARAVSQISRTPLLRLCALFHDIGKPDTMTVDSDGCGHFYNHESLSAQLSEIIMTRLKYDSRTISRVKEVIRSHNIVFQPTEKHARRLLCRLGEETLRLLIELELADVKSQNPIFTAQRVKNIQAFSQKAEDVLQARQCFSLRHLALNGTDLLALGIPQGPQIGRILHMLLEQVIEGSLQNEKQALYAAVRKLTD